VLLRGETEKKTQKERQQPSSKPSIMPPHQHFTRPISLSLADYRAPLHAGAPPPSSSPASPSRLDSPSQLLPCLSIASRPLTSVSNIVVTRQPPGTPGSRRLRPTPPLPGAASALGAGQPVFSTSPRATGELPSLLFYSFSR
jgi:hypothetical protein